MNLNLFLLIEVKIINTVAAVNMLFDHIIFNSFLLMEIKIFNTVVAVRLFDHTLISSFYEITNTF